MEYRSKRRRLVRGISDLPFTLSGPGFPMPRQRHNRLCRTFSHHSRGLLLPLQCLQPVGPHRRGEPAVMPSFGHRFCVVYARRQGVLGDHAVYLRSIPVTRQPDIFWEVPKTHKLLLIRKMLETICPPHFTLMRTCDPHYAFLSDPGHCQAGRCGNLDVGQ